jgi:hypothetical protein
LLARANGLASEVILSAAGHAKAHEDYDYGFAAAVGQPVRTPDREPRGCPRPNFSNLGVGLKNAMARLDVEEFLPILMGMAADLSIGINGRDAERPQNGTWDILAQRQIPASPNDRPDL